MNSGSYRMKEILAFVALFFLSVHGGKDHQKAEFEFGFKDVKHKTAIDHEITANHHEIIIRKMGKNNGLKGKVISLPHPLKGNWKQKVKLGNMDDAGEITWDKDNGKEKGNGKGKGKGKKDKGLKKGKGNNKGKGKKNKKSKSGRIVGGNEVEPPNALPWQVALVQKRSPWAANCGATILCSRYVMTAAHCVEAHSKFGPPSNGLIVAGAHNIRDTSESTRTEHRIAKFIVHPNRMEHTFDYAVLELIDPIRIRPEARPLFLPQPSDQRKLSPSTTFVVSGWGDLYDDSKQGSAKLMFAKVPYITDSECMGIWGELLGPGTETAFCAGYQEEGGIDACQGDSGGPLAFLDRNKVKLIGVVSTGGVCGQAGNPGIYAKMSVVVDWVNEVTGGCNGRVCRRGKCMTGEDLGSAQRYFHSWKK